MRAFVGLSLISAASVSALVIQYNSAFTPGAVIARSPPARPQRARNGVAGLVAKKGKPSVPINQRGGFVQQQKMMEARQAMVPDANSGLPVFNLFVQTPRANIWYPCGAFQGDDQSKNLMDAWLGNSLGMGGMVKNQIDRSVAATIFGQGEENRRQLVQNIVKQYPALKSAQKELVFGYKIQYPGLEDKEGKQAILPLNADMMEGPLDKLKNAFNFGNN